MPTSLVLVRHAETEWNREGRWQGSSDSPLTERGLQEAHELATRLAPGDVVYSSDAARARETAAILAAASGAEIRAEPRLAEVDFGACEGLTATEIEARHGRGVVAQWRDGKAPAELGIERDEAMAERVLAALGDIAASCPGARVIVVTSGGPIRAVQAEIDGVEQSRARATVTTVGNCEWLEVTTDGRTFQLS